MAESKKSSNESTTKTTLTKVKVIGPVDQNSGSTILRFERDAESKDAIDILPGQTLTVGGNSGDITKAEAERLLAYDRWEFEGVEE
ncbi:hypothetical protein ACSS31_28905 (plasmid) [Priestia megaterium]